MDGGELSVHPAVAIREAELSYPTPEGELPVLCGIDMEVRHGEILAVMGPSGSGKSSIIALIGGLEKATGGEVIVLGHDLRDSTDSELTALRRNDIGIVFQSYHLVPAMTALQNAALPLILAGEVDAQDRAKEMLQKVGLGHRLTHRPASLSGGEQQRVAIARAFVSSPQLILADERKLDTRRKIVLGGTVLVRAVEGDGWAVTARTEALALMSERDRALFEAPSEGAGEGGSDE